MTILTTTQLPSPIFTFDDQDQQHFIRTARDPAGQLWFVAKDACKALGLSNTSQVVSRLAANEKGNIELDTPGGKQRLLTVNQSGLFAMAFQSRKPSAVSFRQWVTGTVLPAVFLDGGYFRGEELLQTASTAAEVQEIKTQLQASAAQAIEAKTERGLNGLEERLARHDAFKFIGKGRQRTKRQVAKQPRLGGAA